MENRAGKLKIHSTISKKGRGRLVSLMAEKQIETIEDMAKCEWDLKALAIKAAVEGE